jgi:ElaB/YqjD/DUF883 family membrane-anchored ribosome-binding protein
MNTGTDDLKNAAGQQTDVRPSVEKEKDTIGNVIGETWDKVEDKAEELWKQFQAKTGFSDEKINDLKAKASHKVEDIRAEIETWDDEAKEKWDELKVKAGRWWARIKDKFDGDDDNPKIGNA